MTLASWGWFSSASPYVGQVEIWESSGSTWSLKKHPDGVTDLIFRRQNAYNESAEPAVQTQYPGLHLSADPWFEMAATGGILKGEIRVAQQGPRVDPTYWQTPIASRGDYVRFGPLYTDSPSSLGVTWAWLLVQHVQITAYEQRFTLTGYSAQLEGRPAHADGSTQDFGSGSEATVGQAVEWILNNRFNDSTLYPWASNRVGSPTLSDNGSDADGFQANSDSDCWSLLDDLSLAQQAGSNYTTEPVVWGVNVNSIATTRSSAFRFYFHKTPSSNVIELKRNYLPPTVTIGGTAATALNYPSVRDGNFYNVLELTGNIDDNTNENIRKVYRDSAGITAASGIERRAREEVPSIKTTTAASNYKSAFFARFAQPGKQYSSLRVIINSAGSLPEPWDGYCNVTDSDGSTQLPIKRVRVTFAEQPIADITLGHFEPASLMVPQGGGDAWTPGVANYAAEGKRRKVRDHAAVASSSTPSAASWQFVWNEGD